MRRSGRSRDTGLPAADVVSCRRFHMSRFAAVWRPGSGEQRWRTGMSLDEFKSHDTDFFQKGLRLADLSIRGDNVAAVWRAGSGEQHWRTGMTVDDFKAHDTELFNKGLRLAD